MKAPIRNILVFSPQKNTLQGYKNTRTKKLRKQRKTARKHTNKNTPTKTHQQKHAKMFYILWAG